MCASSDICEGGLNATLFATVAVLFLQEIHAVELMWDEQYTLVCLARSGSQEECARF